MSLDSEIQQAVLRELHWDTRVDETDVGVEVDHGVVTLTGTVDSFVYGSDGFVEAASALLVEAGQPRDAIRTERFGPMNP